MGKAFEELAYQRTSIGDLVLRVRRSPSLDNAPVYEVKLNDEFLVSSAVTNSEAALADRALDAWGKRPCDVVIGGLGLGYTAAAALRHRQVRCVRVLEYLQPVIDWHIRRMLPLADTLLSEPRCELIQGDFFQTVAEASAPTRRYDVILVDIDHSPESWLRPAHQAFYSAEGLRRMAEHLTSEGVFGLWSAERPSGPFMHALKATFPNVRTHDVRYHHPMLHRVESNTIVVAKKSEC